MSTGAQHDADLTAAEQWFVRRGLPHFVERRDSAWTIWSRAIPLLVVAYVLLGLNALDLYHWSFGGNLLAALFAFGVLAAIWIGSNVARRRPPFQRPSSVGPVELGLLVIVPAVPSALFGQWSDVAETLAAACWCWVRCGRSPATAS